MKLVFVLFLTSLVANVICDRVVVGRRTKLPSKNWVKLSDAPDSMDKNFFIALKQSNLGVLNALYEDRSNPSSPKYREWLTIDQINQLVSPPEQNVDAVIAWLKSSGASKVKVFGDAIEVTASVGALKAAFKTSFVVFQNERGQKTVSHWGDISIPAALSSTIDMVVGLDYFPVNSKYSLKSSPLKKRIQKRQIFDFDTYVVPQTLWQVYQIPSNYTLLTKNSSQGVIEWEGQYFNPQDLKDFSSNTALPTVDIPSSDHVIGPNDPTAPGEESTLDIEWISATGLGVQNWFWIEAGTTWLYGFTVHFMNTENVPLVNSMSYGWNEEDQCEDGIGGDECNSLGVNSTQYVQRVNTEFQKIGLRGITLLAASGDSGANGRTDESCSETHFNPPFPAASPYVTAVGATRLEAAKSELTNPPPVCKSAFYWFCASGGNEEAVSYLASGFASGGGFSNVAPLQSWQTDVVQKYLETPEGKKAPASYYNSNGRAFPDIAALGDKIIIYLGGSDSSVGGTSCSSPIVAGLFALLNDYALSPAGGGKPLGPMNQLIYKMYAEHPSAFTDITVGDNSCTESGCGVFGSCKGYYCATGWDPVTGLGSPVFTEMLAYVKKTIF